MPNFEWETQCQRQGCMTIAGIDEAGRGPWAGPVIAAAVIFHRGEPNRSLSRMLDDSKKLTAQKRQALVPLIMAEAHYGIGFANVAEIDAMNILQATFLAMQRALENLPIYPDMALIDGNRAPSRLKCAAQTIVEGDGKSFSIAAASILAKEHRDALMKDLATQYPGYGWETNAGYGTKAHQAALRRLGPAPEHRRSFRPVSQLLNLTI